MRAIFDCGSKRAAVASTGSLAVLVVVQLFTYGAQPQSPSKQSLPARKPSTAAQRPPARPGPRVKTLDWTGHDGERIHLDERAGLVTVDRADGPVTIRLCRRGPTSSGALPALPQPYAQAVYPACLLCHDQLENAMEHMFGMDLDCTFCHGGDPYATKKDLAHVHPDGTVNYDMSIPPIDQDLDYQRFVNPSNLRTVDDTCGLCHQNYVHDVRKGMMSTTAGHFAGGLYLNNVVDSKWPLYGNFAVSDDDGYVPDTEGAVQSLDDMISYDPSADPNRFASHYAAVPSQQCARCHLWSRGKGYRGNAGWDGLYRADGCAACHMAYDNDGLSLSADPSIDHTEQGHPRVHVLSRSIQTEQCVHCHHRGGRIGLNFTGRAQMPPRLPSGPGVPGTTDELFNGGYHMDDSTTNPADIHHERGMHCIDCHIATEVMGDGNIWGHMDQATKIECRSCHGLPGQEPTLTDNDGSVLPNVVMNPGGEVILTSKVTGAEHVVPLVMDIVDPASPSFNPDAAACMDDVHLKADGGLECYACHTSWIPNCYGCHFERDEREVGLNMFSGQYEVGKVSTSNKIFESLRAFSLGPNSEQRFAPYMVSCQPIADVTAPDGSKILDFVMPVTSNGLSGLGLNPIQPHTVRGHGVRTCAECHRAPPSLGLGTGNYAIARDRVYTAGPAGTESFDREADPCAPAASGAVSATPATAVASRPNVVEGTADHLFVAMGPAGVAIHDRRLSDANGGPIHTITGVDAIDVAYAARYLYVVDAGVGVRIYDSRRPEVAPHVASISIPQALRVVPWGIHLFVAAGNGGLVVVDVADHAAPAIEGVIAGMQAADVELYAHYQAGADFAVRAYVADPAYGVRVVDLLPDFGSGQVVGGLPLVGASGLDAYTRYLAASGSTPSEEHDYLYVAAGAAGLHVFDMTDPDAIVAVSSVSGGDVRDVVVASQLAPPGVDDYAYLADAAAGLSVVDVTDPTSPSVACAAPAGSGALRVLVEVQQMDRFLDEQGGQVKENSHPFIEPGTHADIVRLLKATIP
ncbi:MAG: hypothetical protein QF903_13570 [Planctomycetota bacterium]|jgi:hypothetical protein|nr:hypothetical protein [Planctomycetota bacterium]MDP6762819.1 hypothetical protein [Planctomycetota bacterium]MDP6990493.1 hypothetical protein [Planctomycetota bacterium]